MKLSEPVRFLALGDSYTVGTSIETSDSWPNQLFDRLREAGYKSEKIQIIAHAGWRTDDLQEAIRRENPAADFNLVSLLIGVNNQYQGAPIGNYENEFEDLLNTAVRLTGGNINAVFVLSIPDYSFTPFGQGFSNAGTEIDQYNAINRNIAKKNNIAYFDITDISRQGLTNPELLANDGLHPSGLMYKQWVDLIMNYIRIDNPPESDVDENITPEKLMVFPNPASDKLTIQIKSGAVTKVKSISVYSLTGKLQYRIDEIPYKSDDNIPIDIHKLGEGIYILEVSTESKRYFSKIIKTSKCYIR